MVESGSLVRKLPVEPDHPLSQREASMLDEGFLGGQELDMLRRELR